MAITSGRDCSCGPGGGRILSRVRDLQPSADHTPPPLLLSPEQPIPKTDKQSVGCLLAASRAAATGAAWQRGVAWRGAGRGERRVPRRSLSAGPGRRAVCQHGPLPVLGAVPGICRRALESAGIEPADLSAFIPHQANIRIIDSAARALQLPPDAVVARDIINTGNISSASIPLVI
ncbi:3-oxoacyl-[acyl-carrier-protein] synthase III C-terminal domain-containing protein [Streptomyces sp. NPDC051909]|uniref:3-oxoacyl-[acyl-carrier-protein] synthase III C-terminal domain-containing protein n=1 Tax=Streptomyces sp. NPDC051909 TaxID=3154944 RepID=UPI003437C742